MEMSLWITSDQVDVLETGNCSSDLGGKRITLAQSIIVSFSVNKRSKFKRALFFCYGHNCMLKNKQTNKQRTQHLAWITSWQTIT